MRRSVYPPTGRQREPIAKLLGTTTETMYLKDQVSVWENCFIEAEQAAGVAVFPGSWYFFLRLPRSSRLLNLHSTAP